MKILKKFSFLVVLFSLVFNFTGSTKAHAFASPATVNLGGADSFSILSYAGVTDATPASTIITGNVGVSPLAGSNIAGLTCTSMTGGGKIYEVDSGYNVTGFAACAMPGDTVPANKTFVDNAVGAAGAAYTDANNNTVRPFDATNIGTGSGTWDLAGLTIAPGVYSFSGPGNVIITGDIHLTGTASDVWIFRVPGTLDISSAKSILLSGGAQASNIFWVVGGATTLETTSVFEGNILDQTSVALLAGATLHGRAFSNTASVTLDGAGSHTVSIPVYVTPPTPPSTAPQGGGPLTTASVPPLISVLKVPTPLALPLGPGPVTYTYTVKNIGTVPMSNVIVSDNACSTVGFISGDSNNDSKLDINETWTYTCTTTLSQTTTNTVTATGDANGFTAIDTANATVVVGVPIIPPLIHVVKKPNVFVLPANGGAVTYTYTVTNPGTAPLSNVSITDDKCTGLPGRVVGHPGDLNKNDLLESNETWTFTCLTNLTQTTTNTGTAEGSANGLTAIDYSLATVVVAAPSLPKTGLPPAPWNVVILLLFGLLALVSISFVMVLRKHKI